MVNSGLQDLKTIRGTTLNGGILEWIDGSVDIGTVNQSDEPESPQYIVDWSGQKCVRINHDSRAAGTALPVRFAEGLPSQQRGEFRIASGATVPNLGRVVLPTMDVDSFRTRLEGSITEVGRPLLSAGEAGKAYDGCVFIGGNLVPRDGRLGRFVNTSVG